MKIKVFFVFLILLTKPIFSSFDRNPVVQDLSNCISIGDNDRFVKLLTTARLTPEHRTYLFEVAKGMNNDVVMNNLLENGAIVNKVNKPTNKPIDITVFSQDDERKEPDNFNRHSSSTNKPIPINRKPKQKLESIPEEPKPDNQDIPKSKAPESTINPASKWRWKPILFGIGVVAILGGWIWNYFYSKNKNEDPED